jgi:ferrous iron transport protein B
MLMGFGCTVPAAVAARAMDNPKDKRMTILLLPFMSCSAKLPVYGLIAGALFGKSSGLVILSLYGLGIIFGILSGLFFRTAIFGGSAAPFVMEFAPYRLPLLKNIFIRVWERVSHFVEKAGTIILAMSVLLWFLQNFNFSLAMTPTAHTSMLYTVGVAIAPVFKPLGFGTWQASVALLTGLIAKETVVTSLTLFYGGSGAVADALSGAFTPLSAYNFLVFVLLYTPCIAAMATIRRETESPKLTAFIIFYQIAVAYLAALFVYTLGGLLL